MLFSPVLVDTFKGDDERALRRTRGGCAASSARVPTTTRRRSRRTIRDLASASPAIAFVPRREQGARRSEGGCALSPASPRKPKIFWFAGKWVTPLSKIGTPGARATLPKKINYLYSKKLTLRCAALRRRHVDASQSSHKQKDRLPHFTLPQRLPSTTITPVQRARVAS